MKVVSCCSHDSKSVETRLFIHTYHLMVTIVGLYRFFVWFTKGSACPKAHRMKLFGVESTLLFCCV